MSKFKVGDKVRFNQKTINMVKEDFYNPFLQERPSFNNDMKQYVFNGGSHTIIGTLFEGNYLLEGCGGYSWNKRWLESIWEIVVIDDEEYV